MSKDSTINNDTFLIRQGIEVEESQFLQKFIERKQKGVKQQFNLRDLHGQRLNQNWKPGDTILSVILKIMKQRVIHILDPDTYSKEAAKQTKEYILRQKVMIMGMLICAFVPLSIYSSLIKPKLNRVRREYFLQFYNKMGFFNKELGVKTKPTSHKDLQNSL